ncbi:DUF4136 domain-containing protein [Hanstruepera flava]|uniref:DUF4136 domain-containing protein n=1 Tax=Hanstruepera flava TaxID=2930218 RepID=UPI0020289A70|nr:DUF4136 domain-containing protein [Hanstruepera flava]
MKKLALIIYLLLFVSCGVTVNYDYQKGTDFTKYKTYHYFDNMETGLSQLDNKRFFRQLNIALEAKGFTMSNDPDFLIDIASSYRQDTQSSTSVGFGVGTGGGGVSVGVPVGDGNLSRQIIFDFVDAQTEQLVWQAASNEPYMPENTPEAREAQFKVVIDKVLQGFPPKAK